MVVADALALIQDFKRGWVSKNSLQKENALRWHPKPPGVVKLNVDVATLEDVQGAILPDDKGIVIIALSKIKDWVAGADDIETIAGLRHIQMVYTIGVCDIILGGDSLWMVDALNSSSPNLLSQGSLFDDIKILLQHFNSYEGTHVGSEGNAVAHKLARHAQFVDDMEVW
ncbi:hypothetical protein AAC387_Pa09g0464 [Persea americana]